MKSLKIVLIALLTVVTVLPANAQRKRIKGSGDIETEKRDLSGFTGVQTATGIDIYLTQGSKFEVIVEADDNLIEYIKTRVDDGILKVSFDKINVTWSEKKVVHVTMKEIDYIKASSAGDVIGKNLIR
ncbi:MAG: DUF2807 domain-containing protein, partial [Bacteroidales bacterium]|nr:DUF2807 domain-containing protein [Bacteroidales bacterium]